MDLRDTEEEQAFRRQARAWLRQHVPASPLPAPGTPEGFAAHREWERLLHTAGYAGLHWPPEYGGGGAGVVVQAIFEEEYLLAGAPERVNVVGTKLMGPTLMAHGTAEQRERWLPGILAADDVWSQGFSEPEAGSDLAGIRTRAEREGDAWILNGQKIWTSHGAFADWIFVLARSDPEARRHDGISFLAVDLRSPGIEVRPIVQIDGHGGFAEVFLTDVRVPGDQVIGAANDGWRVAMTTLAAERDSPARPAARYLRDLRGLARTARARGLADDPAVRDRLGGLLVRAESYRHQALRTLSVLAEGGSLGASASATKLLWSELERDLVETGLDLLGPEGESLEAGSPAGGEAWRSTYWYGRAATIYAGTSEIQRTIVAERVLGLPRAPGGER